MLRANSRLGQARDVRRFVSLNFAVGAVPVSAVLAALLVAACNDVPRPDYEKMKARAEAAERALDELKNGAPRLLLEAKAAMAAKNYQRAADFAERLASEHPEAPEAAEASAIKKEALGKVAEAAAIKRQEAEKTEKTERQRLASALKSLRSKKDEVRGVEFFEHSDSAKFLNSRSEVALYFSVRNSNPETLRLKIQYVAADWLFIGRYTIKADDTTFEIAPAYGDIERDNGDGNIWEWYDVAVGPREQAVIDAMLAAKKVTIRHDGKQYYRDRVIPGAELERMRQVLTAYRSTTKTDTLLR